MSTQGNLPADTDSGPAINAVCVVFLILALLCVALRTFLRVKVMKSVGWDDGFIILAAVGIFTIVSTGAR